MIGTICVILTVILLVFVLAVGQYNDAILNLGLMYTDIRFEMSFLIYTLIIFALGIFTCSLLTLGQFFDTRSKYGKLKKQYEKTNIGAENADEKIKLLENKIKTLEIALQKQIENNK